MALNATPVVASPTSGKLGTNVSLTSATREFTLGDMFAADDGNCYIYVRANGAVAAYAACTIDEAFDVAELTTTTAGSKPQTVVVPQLAMADNEYGWAVIKGVSFSVLALTLCAADVKVYTTATAGAIDDTATTLIQGLRLNATVGGSTAATSASAEIGMLVNAES